MSQTIFKTNPIYTLDVKITSELFSLGRDLKPAEKCKMCLEEIDEITAMFPNEFYFTAQLHKDFEIEAFPIYRPDKVTIKRHGQRGKITELKAIYGETPVLSGDKLAALLVDNTSGAMDAALAALSADDIIVIKTYIIEFADTAEEEIAYHLNNNYLLKRRFSVALYERGVIEKVRSGYSR